MWSQIMTHTDPMLKLKSSTFRRSFSLGELELIMLAKYGWTTIRAHAEKIVRERLGQIVDHDGKQTPYKGHPVFIAQHATATCCRKCLFKWHRIPRYRDLNEEEVQLCLRLILRWISSQEDKHVSSDLLHAPRATAIN